MASGDCYGKPTYLWKYEKSYLTPELTEIRDNLQCSYQRLSKKAAKFIEVLNILSFVFQKKTASKAANADAFKYAYIHQHITSVLNASEISSQAHNCTKNLLQLIIWFIFSF